MATREQLIEDFADHKYATGEKFERLINSMKVVQEPVETPAASGTSLSFIDSIEQDKDGKITATKKTLDLSNAHELNPFKGWYKTGDTLPTDGFDGAYLYFKDTSELTGQTTIYRWNGTAYADTGTVVDTSNVQTFGSGQAVNAVKIKNESGEEVQGSADVLSAEAGLQLAAKLRGVTMEETKVQLFESGDSQNIFNGQVYTKGSKPPTTTTSSSYRYIVINVEGYKYVRFLGRLGNVSSIDSGWAFYDSSNYNEEAISGSDNGYLKDNTGFISYSTYDYDVTLSDNLGTKEYCVEVPSGAKYFKTCVKMGGVTLSNFYCYLGKGDSVLDLIEKTDEKILQLYTRPTNYQLGYLNFSGDIVDSEERCVTDFIEYNSDGSINGLRFNFGKALTHPDAYILFYDANKNLSSVGRYLVNANTRVITDYSVRVNKYVRFSFPLAYKNIVSLGANTIEQTSFELIYKPEDTIGDIESISKEAVEKSIDVILTYRKKSVLNSGQIYCNEGVGKICNKQYYDSSTTQYYYSSVNEGDTFELINCLGGSYARQYCFLDDEDIILEVASASSDSSPLKIIAPQGATQLIVNSLNLVGEVYKIVETESIDEYERLSNEDNKDYLEIPYTIFNNSYILTNGGIRVSAQGSARFGYVDISNFKTIIYSRWKLSDSTAGDNAAIVFLDDNYQVIIYEKYGTGAETPAFIESVINVPPNAKYCAGSFPENRIDQFYLKGVTKDSTVEYINSKVNEIPIYSNWRSRYSLMKDFGTQPAADGTTSAFCNVLTGDYSDLLTTVYEPLRALYPNYITRTNIGKDASGEIDMYVYDFQPKYYQQHIYLQAGVHAVEPEAVGALARIMYLISHAMDGNDDDLKFVRQNIRFTVVPCVNVWGFSQSPKVIANSEGENMQAWGDTNTPQEMQNIKDYIFNNNLLKEFSFMMDMHTTTNNSYSNFYGALQRHAKNSRTIFRVNSWLYDNYIPTRGVVHNEGKDLGYRETSSNIFRMYWYNKGVETFTPEFTDDIWDGKSRCTSVTQSVALSMYLNYMIQMMNDFYVSMYDVPNSDYHQTAG